MAEDLFLMVGRRRLRKSGEKQTRAIRVLLAESEHQTLLEIARQHGVTLSHLVKAQALALIGQSRTTYGEFRIGVYILANPNRMR